MIVFTRTVSAGWALNMLHGLLEIHSMLLENYNFQRWCAAAPCNQTAEISHFQVMN